MLVLMTVIRKLGVKNRFAFHIGYKLMKNNSFIFSKQHFFAYVHE